MATPAARNVPPAGAPDRDHRRALTWALTLGAAAAAFGLGRFGPAAFERLPFAPYMIAAGLVTLYGGFVPGLVILAWAFVATHWLTSPPVFLVDDVGALLFALPTLWFIEHHRRAVQALRESEQKYARLCELSSDIILDADLTGRIVSVNAAGTRLGGRPLESIVGRDTLDFVAPEDRERVLASQRALLGGARSDISSLELNIVTPDGFPLTVDVRSGVALSRGAPVGFHTVARDVTERRRLERQLRQSQKMEAIGRLAGGVAHDFNNLLTAIGGFTQLAAKALVPGHPAEGYLAEVQKAADQATQIVRQLLAFGRRQTLRPVVLSPNDALADIEGVLRGLAGPRVALAFDYGADAGSIKVDPHQLTQVVMNLVVNARDASAPGGLVTVSTRSDVVPEGNVREGAVVEPGPYVVLTVVDEGIGMDESTRSHIFEPFFTTKREGEGTGLGLATVYGIVKQSGGYIWVKSEPGRGSRFDIYLPRVDAPGAPACDTLSGGAGTWPGGGKPRSPSGRSGI